MERMHYWFLAIFLIGFGVTTLCWFGGCAVMYFVFLMVGMIVFSFREYEKKNSRLL